VHGNSTFQPFGELFGKKEILNTQYLLCEKCSAVDCRKLKLLLFSKLFLTHNAADWLHGCMICRHVENYTGWKASRMAPTNLFTRAMWSVAAVGTLYHSSSAGTTGTSLACTSPSTAVCTSCSTAGVGKRVRSTPDSGVG